jgi:hypothetical protein
MSHDQEPPRPPYGQQPSGPGRQPQYAPQQPWPPYGQQQPYGQAPPPPQWQQPYAPPQPPGPPGRRRKRRGLRAVLFSVLGLVVVIIAISAALSGGRGQAPAAATSAPSAAGSSSAAPGTAARHTAAAAATQTVTYVVKGTPGADVTYGPSGSDLTGSVPMRITKKLADPAYYDIQAQLQGSGSVTVEILIDGKVLSTGHASGGYNIAMAEISQDPFTGKWQDDQ